MNALLNFCIIFLLIYGNKAQNVKCDYDVKNRETNGAYKSTNAAYYTCLLDTEHANYDEKITRIDGQHGTGKSDADVKWITIYEDYKLKTFSSIFSQKFPNLEEIWILNAELNSTDEDSLSNCKNLTVLFLYGNKIREFPEYLLIRNPKLTVLWAQNNQLTTLPENLFLNQKKLYDLLLNDNLINFLPSNIFHSLVKLEALRLHNNQLQSIDPEWFVKLQNLKYLALNGNQISEIPSKCFAALRNLEDLYLYENRIETLNSESFDGLYRLQILVLNENKLTTIHSDSFGVHNHLIYIWLRNNKINAIDEKFIDNTAVTIFHMENNICSQSVSNTRVEIKDDLKKCFANYEQRPFDFSNSCGRSFIRPGTIFGGAKIKLGSYPWIAALLFTNGQFFCGGTLVSNRKVVTAAHCVKDKGHLISLSPNKLRVLLGFYNLDIPFETGRVNLSVQSIHINPDWSSLTRSYDADIAVLKLEQDVTFNMYIQPICMTSTDPRIAAMTEGVVVGNGKSGERELYENIPKNLKMPIQTDEICMNKDSFFETLSSGRTFCAGSADGSGVCSGDSGSGFVVKIGTAYYLRGIVSVSLGDPMLGCDVNSYAVFSNALKFVDWINEI